MTWLVWSDPFAKIESMATKEEIRAVFADPQVDGMDALYQFIMEMLQNRSKHIELITLLKNNRALKMCST